MADAFGDTGGREGSSVESRKYQINQKDPSTRTTIEQEKVEKSILSIYDALRDDDVGHSVSLMKQRHLAYLKKGIRNLSSSFDCLDASRPWLCYWILHSMALFDYTFPPDLARDVVDFLSRCQAPSGGYGGGPGQMAHLAPTYAAVLALCTIGTEEAYNSINRPALQQFLLSMHQEDGSFTMHYDGEVDIRGAYCAVVSAVLTNIMAPEMFEATGEWLASCQSYEGGFSALPGVEAHGGYTFCGFAAAVLLQKHRLIDIQSLLRWVSSRQMTVEGGFNGRTNKLVDGCYSFWQGGVFPLIYMALKEEGDQALEVETWHFNQEALQEYILYCCQYVHGGLVDKPGKSRDFYHTCYCLSGLSVAQHCYGKRIINITHDPESLLQPTHPAFNIVVDKAECAHQYFSKLPVPHIIHIKPSDQTPKAEQNGELF